MIRFKLDRKGIGTTNELTMDWETEDGMSHPCVEGGESIEEKKRLNLCETSSTRANVTHVSISSAFLRFPSKG